MRVGNLIGRPPEPDFEGVSDELVNSKVRVGVEIEAESVSDYDLPEEVESYWNITEDGSLKDNGAEFVFRSPLRGASIVHALEVIEEHLSSIGAICNGRTGLHVHMDARGMSTDELSTLAVLYALTERPLFAFAGADRLNNVFCRPVTESCEISIFKALYAAHSDDDYTHALDSARKYSAMNLESVRRLGSIEFRMHYGTYKAKRILLWINILMSLYNKAIEIAARDDRTALLMELCVSGKDNILSYVYGEYADMLHYNADIDHQKCVHAAFDILGGLTPTPRVIKRGSKVHAKIRKRLHPEEEEQEGARITVGTAAPATTITREHFEQSYRDYLIEIANARNEYYPGSIQMVTMDDLLDD
jgi:hypothetical protein